MRKTIIAFAALITFATSPQAGQTPVPEGANVYFAGPSDGDAIKVAFGLPGTQRLQLALGDLNHVLHATPVTPKAIAITTEQA